MAQKKDITEKQVMFTALQKTLCFLYLLAEEFRLINVIHIPLELLSLLILCLRAPEQLLAKRSQQQSQSPHSP